MREGVLFFLFERGPAEATPAPLPHSLIRETIERSLWSAEEKRLLRSHTSYLERRFSLQPDPVESFLAIYEEAARIPGLVGIANPVAHTAHTAKWVHKLFADGLQQVARETPPLHLWTGLFPVSVEPSLADLLAERSASLWLRTAGYEQFGLPNLAHPLQDIRETGWIHSLFELLFDWMYFQKRPLQPGEAIEVPERGRYTLQSFDEGVVALIEWNEQNGH
ncbi:MAG: hypothetical protein N2170_08990 [Bacteroidia bacterium]|nr:hypothetical protein [Bacteroidia bacterium]